MLKCWEKDPELRPQFDECLHYLEKLRSENNDKANNQLITSKEDYLVLMSDRDAPADNLVQSNEINASQYQYLNSAPYYKNAANKYDSSTMTACMNV